MPMQAPSGHKKSLLKTLLYVLLATIPIALATGLMMVGTKILFRPVTCKITINHPLVPTQGPIQHLAIVMDGNRRWAKERGLSSHQGHLAGVEALQRTLQFCLNAGIKILSLYAFSIENFQRSTEEQQYLFKLVDETLVDWQGLFKEHNVKVRLIGDKRLFPTQTQATIQRLEAQTSSHDGLCLNILFCYGGQQEILAAAKNLAQQVRDGSLLPEEIGHKHFKQASWSGDIPAPEIIFRPGGRARLSNFILYDAAYSELEFSPKYWPDITATDLAAVLDHYQESIRTYGR